MNSNSPIKDIVSRNPIIFYVGTLVTGVATGVAATVGFYSSIGMIAITQTKFESMNSRISDDSTTIGELEERIGELSSTLSATQSDNKVLKGELEDERHEYQRATQTIKDLSTEKAALESQLDALHRKMEYLTADMESKTSEISGTERIAEDLKSANISRMAIGAQLERERSDFAILKSRLESANQRLRAQLDAAQKQYADLRDKYRKVTFPSAGGITPVIVEQVEQMRPNTLYQFIDGEITLVARYIRRTDACLITNLHDRCVDVSVGKHLAVNVKGRNYGFRVDGTYVPYQSLTTNERNYVTVTLLLFDH